MCPKYRFTISFDLIDGSWSFYCVYADSEEEAIKIFENLGCPNTFGMFYSITSIERSDNR